MIIEIDKPFRLYRCDTELPPKNWDVNHAKKTNYGTKYGDKGQKNQADLYFFHDHIDVSNSYGESRLKEINKKELQSNSNQTEYFITEAKLAGSIKLIDFSYCHSMFLMIDLLIKNGINVLTNEFTNHEKNTKLESFFVLYNNFKKYGDGINLSNMILINGDINLEYTYFGQLISDFENGIVLKKLLKEKNIDGYRWREHNDPRGLTYCLLDSEKLQKPQISKIEISN